MTNARCRVSDIMRIDPENRNSRRASAVGSTCYLGQ